MTDGWHVQCQKSGGIDWQGLWSFLEHTKGAINIYQLEETEKGWKSAYGWKLISEFPHLVAQVTQKKSLSHLSLMLLLLMDNSSACSHHRLLELSEICADALIKDSARSALCSHKITEMIFTDQWSSPSHWWICPYYPFLNVTYSCLRITISREVERVVAEQSCLESRVCLCRARAAWCWVIHSCRALVPV